MIVRNWMKRDPTTIGSDELVSKAKRILVERNLRALPVVDDGRLRGLISRVNCLRAAEFVARTEDPHEFNFFVNRLKVKDLMVRNPITVKSSDTMEHCLLIGQERRVSQFPVIEDGKVVGIVSASEVFYLAAETLGVWEHWCGITLASTKIERGTLGRVAAVVEETGGTLQSLVTVGGRGENRRIVVRFTCDDIEVVAAALTRAGFRVAEVCSGEDRVCRDLTHSAFSPAE